MNEPRHPADAMLESWHLHEPRTRPAVSRGLRWVAFITAAICAVVIAFAASRWI